jgi:hypothetical protein
MASIDLAMMEPDTRLLMVDPATVFTRETVRKLTQWVSGGEQRVLAMPRSVLFTENARAQLELLVSNSKKIEVNLGVSYRVLSVGASGAGKIVLYDVPEAALTQEMSGKEWEGFVVQVLALAEIETQCLVSDSRIALIPLDRPDDSTGLFVLNGTKKAVSADLLFPVSVSISDLAAEVTKTATVAATPKGREARIEPAKRFALDVPACGVLPIAVDRIGMGAGRAEQEAADHLGGFNDKNAMTAAANELPGLEDPMLSEGLSPWN